MSSQWGVKPGASERNRSCTVSTSIRWQDLALLLLARLQDLALNIRPSQDCKFQEGVRASVSSPMCGQEGPLSHVFQWFLSKAQAKRSKARAKRAMSSDVSSWLEQKWLRWCTFIIQCFGKPKPRYPKITPQPKRNQANTNSTLKQKTRMVCYWIWKMPSFG